MIHTYKKYKHILHIPNYFNLRSTMIEDFNKIKLLFFLLFITITIIFRHPKRLLKRLLVSTYLDTSRRHYVAVACVLLRINYFSLSGGYRTRM